MMKMNQADRVLFNSLEIPIVVHDYFLFSVTRSFSNSEAIASEKKYFFMNFPSVLHAQ